MNVQEVRRSLAMEQEQSPWDSPYWHVGLLSPSDSRNCTPRENLASFAFILLDQQLLYRKGSGIVHYTIHIRLFDLTSLVVPGQA